MHLGPTSRSRKAMTTREVVLCLKAGHVCQIHELEHGESGAVVYFACSFRLRIPGPVVMSNRKAGGDRCCSSFNDYVNPTPRLKGHLVGRHGGGGKDIIRSTGRVMMTAY